MKEGPKLFLVTDPAYSDEHLLDVVARAASALAPGELAVQLRDKSRAPALVHALAKELRVLTTKYGASLVINGDLALAKGIRADGVHLGGDAVSIPEARRALGEGAFISIAAHSDDAVRAAVKQGADAALVSPIFPTTSMPKSEVRIRVVAPKVPRGLDALDSAKAIASGKIRLYALGGVTLETAQECVRRGADGVAVIRALLTAEDPSEHARAFVDAVVSASSATM